MEEFFIEDNDLRDLKGKVVIVTGGSSGIGLATVQLLLELDAKVVAGDRNPTPITHPNLSFKSVDVTSWPSQLALFNHAIELHGRIDHVFANAGIAGRADYLASTIDPTTNDLAEPATDTFEINLRGMINTSYLGLHHIRNRPSSSSSSSNGEPPSVGGSIVCTASASSFQRFRVVDYTTAKHGVLGFMRGIVPLLQAEQAEAEAEGKATPVVRVNCISPSWTGTGIVPADLVARLGFRTQSAEAVARSVVLLMADSSRQGQMIYSSEGRYWEVEEAVLLPAGRIVAGAQDEDAAATALFKARESGQAGQEGGNTI